MEVTEIKALVSLLEDEDPEIISHIEQKIMSLGDVIIPFLEVEWESQFNSNVQKRIEDLIHLLQLSSLKTKLKEWKETEPENLLKGVFLVATYQYPDLDYKKIKKDVDKIYYEAWLSHRTYASPFDQVRNLNHIIFNKFGFTSNTQNFHAPGNSMLNVVMETRRGNPIALCTIYMLVAQRLKMPIYGVNLPNLFVLTYKSDETQFYINAFNKGLVFSKSDIDNYIAQLRLKPDDKFYQPCSNPEIVQRILRNLIVAFERLGEPEKVEEVKSVLSVISESWDGMNE
ncbi:MAG: transglutaminase-like domain-containing protein [Microscillaceae bacterium]|jgi:regulator of sirC expression with transglutaminase-like and TPR domain|nr:transglutaminase-like domain-containing protein [Microscillaceae bacterium]